MDYSKIITIEPGKMGGKPCIRGMLMAVYDVLDYLASGMTEKRKTGRDVVARQVKLLFGHNVSPWLCRTLSDLSPNLRA